VLVGRSRRTELLVVGRLVRRHEQLERRIVERRIVEWRIVEWRIVERRIVERRIERSRSAGVRPCGHRRRRRLRFGRVRPSASAC
jgi:hypothetical protein